ncbi:hypothetical protein DVH05_008530 [Phytophthora capsici]|nr:hypothetical protein DVH05_008530 [Phytophthora capsici]
MKTLRWLKQIDLALEINDDFKVPQRSNLKERLKQLPITSLQVEQLDIGGKGTFGDATMKILLYKLFGGRENVVYIKPTSLGVIVNGSTAL